MIQRVQTIFLFIITVAMGVALINPLWEKTGSQLVDMAQLSALQYSEQHAVAPQPGVPLQSAPSASVTSVWYLGFLLGLVALSSLYAVFQYRNRLTQTALCAVNALMLTAIMGIVLYRTLYVGKAFGNPADSGHILDRLLRHHCGFSLQCAGQSFIRRDEKLVRGSDRLR